MIYYIYHSPVGRLLLINDGKSLIGLYPEGAPSFREDLPLTDTPKLFADTLYWLDNYFQGKKPSTLPSITVSGTDYQKEVWEILIGIPYGKTMTYGEIAEHIAHNRGISQMSAQAVGNAVGANPISILIPCHRVLGAGGRLTGYAAGLECKRKLLDMEGIAYK